MTAHTGAVPETPRKSDWRDAAACRTEDPEDFFPIGASPAAKAAERHAKTVCFACPSYQACGQWALETRQAFGIWGGMTEAERAKVLRRRGIRLSAVEDEAPQPVRPKRGPAQCGTRGGYQKHLREKTTICAPCRQANTDADNRLRRTGTSKVPA
jgi:hypothetical protein